MICKVARYRIQPAWRSQALQAIETFVEAIAAHEPHTHYAAYQEPDGLTFLHLMVFPDAAAEQAHAGAPYTQAFVEALYPNCQAEPTFTDLRLLAAAEARSGDAHEG